MASAGAYDSEFLHKLALAKFIEEWEHREKEWLRDMRGWITVLATIAVTIAYQAGLNPPGGFWQDDSHGHTAGTPVLCDRSPRRYLAFYYLNATTLLTSLGIIVLLVNKRASVQGLVCASMIDIMSLVAAFIVGSTSNLTSSIGLIVAACVVFLFLVYSSWDSLVKMILVHIRFTRNLARLHWFPVPADVVRRSSDVPLDEEQRPAEPTEGRFLVPKDVVILPGGRVGT